MINGVFPQKALADIGMPLERLSQSALLVEMAAVPADAARGLPAPGTRRAACASSFGTDPATELTRDAGAGAVRDADRARPLRPTASACPRSACSTSRGWRAPAPRPTSPRAPSARPSASRSPTPTAASSAPARRSPASTRSTWARPFRRPCCGGCSIRSACRRRPRCTTSAGAASSRAPSTGISRSPARCRSRT